MLAQHVLELVKKDVLLIQSEIGTAPRHQQVARNHFLTARLRRVTQIKVEAMRRQVVQACRRLRAPFRPVVRREILVDVRVILQAVCAYHPFECQRACRRRRWQLGLGDTWQLHLAGVHRASARRGVELGHGKQGQDFPYSQIRIIGLARMQNRDTGYGFALRFGFRFGFAFKQFRKVYVFTPARGPVFSW